MIKQERAAVLIQIRAAVRLLAPAIEQLDPNDDAAVGEMVCAILEIAHTAEQLREGT